MSAELLRRAAAKLREAAKNATEGPWGAAAVRSPDSHATSALYSYAHPTGTPESEVVPSARKGWAGIKNPGDAVYFEVVHPPVALALADWLEMAAQLRDGADLHPAVVGVVPDYAVAVALAVLRKDGESA